MTATVERAEPLADADTPVGRPPYGPTRRYRRGGPRLPVEPMGPAQVISMVVALSLCALALWCTVYVLVISSLEHARAQHQLYSRFRSELALATAPIGGTIRAGQPVAVLTIPGAALHGEVVVEGTTARSLQDGPGHMRTTPLPGQAGATILYGRALSFGAPFAKIDSLRSGDPITVTTDQGTFHYAVTDVRRAGDPWQLPTSDASTLTLVTTRGGWTPDSLVYVDAALKGKPAPAPSGRPAVLAVDERAMAGQHDTLTLVQIVLWLQLLLVVACALTWLWKRWSRWQVWLVGAPALLAVIWGTSNIAVRVLPNLL